MLNNKLSIIVPIYKNEENLIPFYEDFKNNIEPKLDDYEIIMVNDDSPDDSWRIMCDLARENPKIKLIKLSRNFGAISATFTGLKYCSGDCASPKAVDLQEPPELLINMYENWKTGNKSVIAVRESRNDSHITNFFSNLYYSFVRKLITKNMPPGGFDTYLIDRKIIDYIIDMNDKNSPITLQLLWMGFSPVQVTYERKKREVGKSSWSFSKKMKLFIDSFINFSYVPIRFMTGVGATSLLVSVVWGCKIAVSKILNQIPVQGYTTITILLLFAIGMLMFTLGIMGEYIWRILENVRNRPITLVEKMVNFDKGDRQE